MKGASLDGIYVCNVVKGTPADDSSVVRKGQRVLSINHVDVQYATRETCSEMIAKVSSWEGRMERS